MLVLDFISIPNSEENQRSVRISIGLSLPIEPAGIVSMVRVPSAGLALLVEPSLEDQEMRTSFVYWEGAVRVSGVLAGTGSSGRGYVEQTGYARSMQGVF